MPKGSWGKPGRRWKGPEWPYWAGPDEPVYIPPKYLEYMRMIARIPSVLVIISLDYCQRTFGSSPCLATGTPCYNTWPTCVYRSAYLAGIKDYKFCYRENPTPLPGQPIRPYIEEIRYLAQEIVPNEALTLNQSLTITMADEPDNDVGIDPYRISPTLRQASGEPVSIAASGTFWRKLKTRNSNYQKRRVTIKKGFVANDYTEADYLTYFVGVLDNIQFTQDGQVKIAIKGLLQLTDVDLPKKTDGRLSAEIDASVTSLTLKAWTGVDRSTSPISSQYDSRGYIKIDNEIIQYTNISLDTNTGITTFSGLTRGKFNGDGWDIGLIHEIDAIVQQVEVFEDQNPIDIIKSLLNKAGISDSDIDTAIFNSERDTWFQGVKFRGILHEPKKVKEYLNELREQTLTNLWQGDDQKIKIDFLGPNFPGQTYREIKDENIIFRSNNSDDHEEKRITRVVIYYDIQSGKSGDKPEEFSRVTVVIDTDAESTKEYMGIKARKPIFSRWIRATLSGDDYSRIIATRLLRRFRDGGKTINFELELKDEGLAIGEVFEIYSSDIVDFDGNPKTSRYQMLKKEQISKGKIQYIAFDTKLKTRYGFVAPNGTPDYGSASASQKEYAFVCNSNGKMSNGDDGYLVI